ncbi:SMI1/KNR4 family protein [Planctomycetales bacterium ZRK34]|nr:SMI1/KNR4 family protein [Planctomycetales bacterium ZRK34]
MPQLMRELHRLEFDYDNGHGIDFEPYDEFMAPDDTTDWFRAWTGNNGVEGTNYLIFGQDGTGGMAAFWLAREGFAILEQPIVFFGSEGRLGVVASNFANYLWLLAANVGPLEATEYQGREHSHNEQFASFASAHAPDAAKSPQSIITAARQEFSNFVSHVSGLCL